jgi:hypothetical protein
VFRCSPCCVKLFLWRLISNIFTLSLALKILRSFLLNTWTTLLMHDVFYSGIKTHNHLPKTIKELSHDVKQFRLALKRFDINWKWVLFCYAGYTAPCKVACWLLILKLILYLICIKFHFCILLTLLIQISYNLYTYILYAAVLFFLVLL